jgi:hypothetical protein
MNNRLAASIQKYLRKYSPERRRVEISDVVSNIDTIVVVPVIDEYDNLQRLLHSLELNDLGHLIHTVFLFVINNSMSTSEKIKEENRKSISYLRNIIRGESCEYYGLQIAMIDASSPGNELPEKTAGVGLARKIGMDEALLLFSDHADFPLLVCLDADCTVSDNYVSAIRAQIPANKIHAAAVQYEHPLNALEFDIQRAIVCYELFLRYYTLGLYYTGSPYAFHTIGSTIVCSAEAYMKAEGMNKKKAGEDFYFLEKLGKMYPVHTINDARVYPAARSSWRVPFGTGKSIERFLNNDKDEYMLFSPQSFVVLKQWLEFYNSSTLLSPEQYMAHAKTINNGLYRFLVDNNFAADWEKIFSGPSHQIPLQKKIWFDGFRTLKLIHYLRDNEFPNIPTFDALDEFLQYLGAAIPIKRTEVIPNIQKQVEYLRLCRQLSVDTSSNIIQ